jgi:FKBP-type peptidyl-prolyl cis-trans isomerase
MDMKLQLGVVALCAVFMASQASAAEKIQLKTDKDKLSYQKGVYLWNDFKKKSIEVDQKIFLRGVEDAMSGAETLLTVPEMVTIEENFQRERAAKKAADLKKLADKNKKEEDTFLAENAKKKGVKILASGMQYKVITAGKGKKPKATDKVRVNYRITQIDGTMLDDSDKHAEHPALMPISESATAKYIPACWTEALQLMNEGSKWQMFCPSKLSFGEQGFGLIGPNLMTIYDIELVSIE